MLFRVQMQNAVHILSNPEKRRSQIGVDNKLNEKIGIGHRHEIGLGKTFSLQNFPTNINKVARAVPIIIVTSEVQKLSLKRLDSNIRFKDSKIEASRIVCTSKLQVQ